MSGCSREEKNSGCLERKKNIQHMFKSNIQCGYTKTKQDFFLNFVLSVHHIPFRTRFATCARDHGNTVHNLIIL